MHPIYGCTVKFWQSSLRTRPLFQKFVMDFCSDRLRMCVQNFKFVALPVTEIIGGTQKIWTVSAYAHAPFSHKILKGFCSDGRCDHTCQIWSSFFTRSWDNSRYSKNLGSPCIHPRPISHSALSLAMFRFKFCAEVNHESMRKLVMGYPPVKTPWS